MVTKGQHFYTPPLDGFESGVKPQVRTCSGGGANCSKEIFDETGGLRLKGNAATLLDYLRLVLLHIGHMQKTGQAEVTASVSDPTTLLRFCCTTDVEVEPRYYLVGHSQDLDKELFEAVFLQMLPISPIEWQLPKKPMTFTFADGNMLLGRRCPNITDELSLVRLLHCLLYTSDAADE